MKRKILDYIQTDVVVTGGQVINCLFNQGLKTNPDNFVTCKIHNNHFDCMKDKLLEPFKFLRNVSEIMKYDMVILASSNCIYYILTCLYLRLFSKTKIVTIHHHYIWMSMKGIQKMIYWMAETLFLMFCHKIVVVSPYVEAETKRRFKNKRVQMFLIPFEKNSDCKELKDRKRTLLFVGTIEKRKGLMFLLEALNYLKEQNYKYSLYVVGKVVDVDYYNQLKCYVQNHDIVVHFLGRVSSEKLNELYNTSKLFVFPSLLEGFGMVMVEAFAHGMPVVCFNNSAMPYVVTSRHNGLVVKNKSTDEFAQSIKEIMSDDNYWNKLSINAKLTAESYPTKEKFVNDVALYF